MPATTKAICLDFVPQIASFPLYFFSLVHFFHNFVANIETQRNTIKMSGSKTSSSGPSTLKLVSHLNEPFATSLTMIRGRWT